jgi:hypothetical protein
VIFAQDRQALRRMFFEAWRKARAGGIMQPLEVQIAEIVGEHPEYHAVLEQPEDAALDRDYQPEAGEANPFLHMALHIAVREQLATDRPYGIQHAFHALLARVQDRHAAEHVLLECLAETLWESQRAGVPPDEQAYLARVRGRLAGAPNA